MELWILAMGFFRRPEEDRPRMGLPVTPVRRILEVVAIGATVAGVALALRYWTLATAPVPHHFDLGGKPDAWGNRGLFLFLGAMPIFSYFVLTLVTRRPDRANHRVRITPANAMAHYGLLCTYMTALKAWLGVFFVLLIWQNGRVALGQAERLDPVLLWGGLAGPIATTLVYYVLSLARRSEEAS